MNSVPEEFMRILEGKKIILRPITIEDTDLIVKWRNNQNVLKNFIFREHLTVKLYNLLL